MEYTAAQRQAIETIDCNLQIIACAGSGKPQVISARIVHILQQGVPPSAVVAFAFTDKAAGELKDLIHRLARRGLGDRFVGTIHGYCLNLLQSSPLYSYLKYTVLNEAFAHHCDVGGQDLQNSQPGRRQHAPQAGRPTTY